MKLDMPRITHSELRDANPGEHSAIVRERVVATRARQLQRAGKPNAWLSNREVEQHCQLSTSGQSLLECAMERLNLSARAYHRILRVGRTIADLADAVHIDTAHLSEAIQYRRFGPR